MTNELTNDEEMNRRRAIAFYEEKLPVHIVKKSGVFYNGIILVVRDSFFTIDDREDGAKNVFYFELKCPIEEFKEDGR